MTQLGYGEFHSASSGSFEDVVKSLKESLATEGFGIVAEMNLQAIFEKKLQDRFRPYIIIGACLPQFARDALEVDPHLGLLLPCNIVVQESEKEGVVVSMVHPITLLTLTMRPDLRAIAEGVENRLRTAIQRCL